MGLRERIREAWPVSVSPRSYEIFYESFHPFPHCFFIELGKPFRGTDWDAKDFSQARRYGFMRFFLSQKGFLLDPRQDSEYLPVSFVGAKPLCPSTKSEFLRHTTIFESRWTGTSYCPRSISTLALAALEPILFYAALDAEIKSLKKSHQSKSSGRFQGNQEKLIDSRQQIQSRIQRAVSGLYQVAISQSEPLSAGDSPFSVEEATDRTEDLEELLHLYSETRVLV